MVLRGEPDPYSGIFVDFGDVEKTVKEHVLDRVDHTNLNDFIENPTAENIATWMWQRLEGKLRRAGRSAPLGDPHQLRGLPRPAREVVNGAA